MGLDADAIEKINQRVYREYPELSGARPGVAESGGRYTLTYKGTVDTPAGRMARIVRVSADETGRVTRISTSK
jgi:hypothetical protein